MHAYLIIGPRTEKIVQSTEELAKKLGAKILEFPIAKIEDTRNLNDLIRLSFSEPTLFILNDINEAGDEALNALLKNLEEPQDNIYFALTAPSVRKVLPTIVSRCQVIKIQDSRFQIPDSEEIERFISMLPGQRLAFSDKIRDRNKAIGFIESLIFCLHALGDLTNMELLIKTLTRIKANGNITLQLANMVIHYA